MTRHTHLLTLTLLVAFGSGCSLVVSFDRSRIGDGGMGSTDGGMTDGGMTDAGFDGGGTDAGPACGNGTMDTGEACDDGNMAADDGCSATCTVEDGFDCTGFGAGSCTPICGDGMTVGDEVCDDGFTSACGACNSDCTAVGTAVACGDGMLCRDTEACDDMNTADLDGCAADCTMIETGFVCVGEPSVCAMTCSNGVIDAGEECDDGRNDDGDGCSAACVIETGYACMGAPSTCDTVCGDGIIVAGEEDCDDTNTADDDGCASDCTFETGWTCSGTPSVCEETCGDSTVVGAEACDDGNMTTETACPYGMATCTNFCNADCTMALSLTGNTCGDSVRDMMNEECDDGDTSTGDGCDGSCDVETGWTCNMATLSVCTPICGDNRVRGTEACDDGNTTTETACPYGTPTCTNFCNADCTMALSLTGNVCGDGVPDGTVETCDDGNLLSCGTCSADCGASQSARAATGSILVTTTAAGTPDGGTFTLGDGTTTVTFELDKNASVTSGNVRVNIGSATTAAEVALAVNNAIDGALGITPSRTAETVSLTNSVGGGANHNGALGNVTIVQGGGLTWTLGGMSAGRGRDCPATTGCASNNDCASRVCTSGSCM